MKKAICKLNSLNNSYNNSKYFNPKTKSKSATNIVQVYAFSAFRRITDPDFLKSPSV